MTNLYKPYPIKSILYSGAIILPYFDLQVESNIGDHLRVTKIALAVLLKTKEKTSFAILARPIQLS